MSLSTAEMKLAQMYQLHSHRDRESSNSEPHESGTPRNQVTAEHDGASQISTSAIAKCVGQLLGLILLPIAFQLLPGSDS
jgi:hypothetical protein